MKRAVFGVLSLAWIGAAAAQTAPVPPAAPPATREAPVEAPAARAAVAAASSASRTEMQELIETTRAVAKATREGTDYNRVVPDILTQILAKLDKIEDKLDKLDTGRSSARKR